MNITELSRRLTARLHEAEGQALAEYGLILAFVAIAAVAGLVLLGGAVSKPISAFLESSGIGGS